MTYNYHINKINNVLENNNYLLHFIEKNSDDSFTVEFAEGSVIHTIVNQDLEHVYNDIRTMIITRAAKQMRTN